VDISTDGAINFEDNGRQRTFCDQKCYDDMDAVERKAQQAADEAMDKDNDDEDEPVDDNVRPSEYKVVRPPIDETHRSSSGWHTTKGPNKISVERLQEACKGYVCTRYDASVA
jgi:hypothetical protein